MDTLSNIQFIQFRDQTVAVRDLNATEVSRYRLFHAGAQRHFYTTDMQEYHTLVAQGWKDEGRAYSLFKKATTREAQEAAAYYRLYHPTLQRHLWTSDENEYQTLGRGEWRQEGVIGYIFLTQVSGTQPLYRLFHAGAQRHHWTSDQHEYQTLKTQGWQDEGIVGYIAP